MKKVIALVAALAGCVAIPVTTPLPATSTSAPTSMAIIASPTPTPTLGAPSAPPPPFTWFFPDKLKDIRLVAGKRGVIGMWLFSADEELEGYEFVYRIEKDLLGNNIDQLVIAVDNIPVFEASASLIVYGANTAAPLSWHPIMGSSTHFDNAYNHITALADVPERAHGTIQMSIDITLVKQVKSGKTLDPAVPIMASDALIISPQ